MWSVSCAKSALAGQCKCVVDKGSVFFELLAHGADYSTMDEKGNTIVARLTRWKGGGGSSFKENAEYLVAERLYRVYKVLAKEGLLPDVITSFVVPYLYGDIKANNKHPDKFLVIDYEKFLKKQVEKTALDGALQKGSVWYGDVECIIPIKFNETRLHYKFIEEDVLLCAEEAELNVPSLLPRMPQLMNEPVAVETPQKPSKWSCFPWGCR